MPSSVETPQVLPGGLVTVAYLKAQLDGGSDHIGMFMPLIVDVLTSIAQTSFTTPEVQEALFNQHGIAMPQHVVQTLLSRAVPKFLKRELGRYFKNAENFPPSNVQLLKSELEDAQSRLGIALCEHLSRRGVHISTPMEAIKLLLAFLEDVQIGMLLGASLDVRQVNGSTRKEDPHIAEFIQDIVSHDAAYLSTLQGMIEGLVLYHAAFLPDLNSANQKFKNLRVVFDSSLIRKALGYEGAAMKTLLAETLSILKSVGVQCLVFDKTLGEIHRILSLYEQKLGTTAGQQSLHPVPMARHLLTTKTTPSGVREMSALLEHDVVVTGFQIIRTPVRIKEYTLGEKQLAERLTAPGTDNEELEPRVMHDVDCIAGILQLREGTRSQRLEDVKAVFAADSPLVIRNTQLWWAEDEQEVGVAPIVHIRALANLAWLKKPTLKSDYKINELVALCGAALRPSKETWERFLRHLDYLKKSGRITSDEITAVLVSSMSDSILSDAANCSEDPDDIDAATLDDVIERVKRTYAADASQEILAVKDDYQKRLDIANEERANAIHKISEISEISKAAESRRHGFYENRAKNLARILRIVVQAIANVLILLGACKIVIQHLEGQTLLEVLVFGAVAAFVLLEFVVLRSHVAHWCEVGEKWVATKYLRWLMPPDNSRES